MSSSEVTPRKHSAVRQWTAFIVGIVVGTYAPFANVGSVEASPLPQTPGVAPVVKVQPKFTSAMALQLRQPFISRANLYTQSMQSLKQVQTMQIRANNEVDAKAAVAKLKALDAFRANYFQRMVTVAEGNAAFKAGIEAAAKQEGAQALADRLTADNASVLKIAGASQAATAVSKSFEADIAVIKAVGEKLKATVPVASLPSGGEPGIAVAKAGVADPWAESVFEPAYGIFAADDAVTVALVAAAVLLISAYAARLAENYKTPDPPAEDTRSPFKKCLDRTDAHKDSCLGQRNCGFFCQAGCYAKYAADIAACALLPQS